MFFLSMKVVQEFTSRRLTKTRGAAMDITGTRVVDLLRKEAKREIKTLL